MHPSQPIPSGSDSNPYDFIMNEPPKQKRSLIPKGESKKQRMIIMFGLGAGVLTILILVFSLIFSAGNTSIENVEAAAKEQQEIIRVAELGERGARSSGTQSFAISVKLAFTSTQQQFLTYLEGRDRKLKDKELNLRTNEETDVTLKAAADSGKFDETFDTVMTEHLEVHKRNLIKYYEGAESKTQKELFQGAYEQITGLLDENTTDDGTTEQ